MATKVNNNQVNESANEVMDNRIVKLNELKSVKMANLSKGKRPAAKEAKLQATHILDNWDNEFELVKMLNDTEVVFNDDIKAILSSRLQNFDDAKEACKKAAQQSVDASQFVPSSDKLKGIKATITKVAKEMANSVINEDSITERLCETGKFNDNNIRKSAQDCIAIIKKAQDEARSKSESIQGETPSVKLTKNEMEVLIAMAVNANHYGEHNAFVMRELKLERPRTSSSLSGTMSTLNKKGMILVCNGDSYFDGEITEAGLKAVAESGMEAFGGFKSEEPAKKQSSASKTKAEKATKTAKQGKATAKKVEKEQATKTTTSTKKVGDIHKNGKWAWTEYAPGKFDWRTIPALKQKTGAKPKTDEATKAATKKSERKEIAKKSEQPKKSNAKQTKKGETKKNSPEAPKLLTIDEFVALPVKTAKNGKKPSTAQAEAFKLIMKGYRVTADKKFFEDGEGNRKSCNWESVVAMFKRYGIDYIPEGLVK